MKNHFLCLQLHLSMKIWNLSQINTHDIFVWYNINTMYKYYTKKKFTITKTHICPMQCDCSYKCPFVSSTKMCNVDNNYRSAELIEPPHQWSQSYEKIHFYNLCIIIYYLRYTILSMYMYLGICLYPYVGLPLIISNVGTLARHVF